MSTAVYFAIVVALVAIGGYGLWRIARAYLRYRGARVITCPDNQAPAGVELSAVRAALAAATGKPVLQLSNCSRWPEKQGCDQACLSQIESSPEGCLVRNMVAQWYDGASCALCGKPFTEIHWHDHKPALIDPSGRVLAWSDIAAEKLSETLSSCRPVCWNCHSAESFRRDFSDLVTDRPPKA